MKKFRLALCMILLAFLVLSSACSQQAKYKDGTYEAQDAEFGKSGWKETVEVTIEGGKVAKISWDAIYKDGSIPIRKKQYSKSGLYGMLAGGASDEWYDQAVAAEQFVLENGIDALTYDDGGYTDVVSGCTVHVNAFDKLYRQCLEQAKK